MTISESCKNALVMHALNDLLICRLAHTNMSNHIHITLAYLYQWDNTTERYSAIFDNPQYQRITSANNTGKKYHLHYNLRQNITVFNSPHLHAWNFHLHHYRLLRSLFPFSLLFSSHDKQSHLYWLRPPS